jgi:hypothetical protein
MEIDALSNPQVRSSFSDEENQRRQIETSLSGADLAELKRMAPDLFAG